jgi:hypothetical protein
MQAESCTVMFTVDTAKPSSRAIPDTFCPSSYSHIILTFIFKLTIVHLRDDQLLCLGSYLPPGNVQNMKVFFNKQK